MEFSARSVGTSFDTIAADLARSYKAANRTVGRDIAKKGKAAIAKGAPRMMGKKLTSKTRVEASGDRAEVTFTPFSVGGWAIAEFGTKAHDIYPKAGRVGHDGRPAALKFAGLYANNAFVRGIAARGLWSKAGERLDEAITPLIEDVYTEALGG